MSSKITSNTVWTFSGMIFFQLINFLVGIIISRFASISDLGAFQFFIITTSFFGFFSKMGIDEKLTYTVPYLGGVKNKKAKKLIYNSFLKVFCFSLLSSISVVIFYTCITFFSVEKIDITDSLFSIIYMPAISISILIGALFRSENLQKIRAYYVYFIPALFTLLSLILIIFLFDLNKSLILLVRTLAYILLTFLGIYYIKRIYKINLLDIRKFFSKLNVIKFDKAVNVWLFIAVITFVIESGTFGMWIIRLDSDDYKIGVISIIIRLACLTFMAPTALGIVFSSLIAKLNHDGKNIAVMKSKLIILSFTVVLISCFFLFVFSEQVLSLFGNELIVYKKELRLMLFGAALIAFTQPITSLSLALKKSNDVFKISLAGFFIYFLCFFYFDFNQSINSSIKAISCSMSFFGILRIFLLFRLQ